MTLAELIVLWLARERRHPEWVEQLRRRPSRQMEDDGSSLALDLIRQAREAQR